MTWTMGQLIEYIKSFGPPAEMPLANGKRMLLEPWLRSRVNIALSEYAALLAEQKERNYYTDEVTIELEDSGDAVMGAVGSLPANFLSFRSATVSDTNGRVLGGPAAEIDWAEWFHHATNRWSAGTLLKPKIAVRSGGDGASGTT